MVHLGLSTPVSYSLNTESLCADCHVLQGKATLLIIERYSDL